MGEIDMSEIAKRRKLCTSVQSEPAISEHAQEHAPPFRAAVLDTVSTDTALALPRDLLKKGTHSKKALTHLMKNWKESWANSILQQNLRICSDR